MTDRSEAAEPPALAHVIMRLRATAPALRADGVRRLCVFGSVARLVVIGEAVGSLLDAARRDPAVSRLLGAHPEIDWLGYVGMRNIIAPRYFRRDPAAIWVTLTDELRDLKRAVEEMSGKT